MLKPVRSWSGVVVVTVVTSPGKFSCPNDCHYCPNEPGQPRSYLSNEPAVARANQNNFGAQEQFNSRVAQLEKNGHSVDKIEIIVLGGTWSSYPRPYQEEFIRDLYFAANTYKSADRTKDSLGYEKGQNETTRYKIIGISLETRPDHVNKYELKRFRNFGCTRVQIGVQHTDDEILKFVNRGHSVIDSINAIKMLRENGFKIDIHVMPDLPGSNPEKDKKMLHEVLTSHDFSPDYMKIYPCLDVKFTKIREWKDSGKWKPYAEEDNGSKLYDVVIHAKKHSVSWTRFNRIQRDFSEEKVVKDVLRIGYKSETIKSNFRQLLKRKAEEKGVFCKCIRCKEIKNNAFDPTKISYKIEMFNAAGGREFFISANTPEQRLLGFIRVRINGKTNITIFKSISNCVLIRELHVYGLVNIVGCKNDVHNPQHFGIGKQLMLYAESIALCFNKRSIAVISGVGVRKYYEKLGYIYDKNGEYMIKSLKLDFNKMMYILSCVEILVYWKIVNFFISLKNRVS
jgi:ELP3 family radical SAM enzyme/protein acetyltransferase